MNNDNSGAGPGETCRGAYLSPLAVIALSFGYAVGWGAFVMPGTDFLPNAGPVGTSIGLLVGTLAVAVLAFNYHRATVGIGGEGGAYGFVTKMFGPNHGFLVGWVLFLSYVAIMWANATALVLLARYLFGNALQFGFHYTMVGFDVYFGEVLLSLAAIVLCGVICLVGKRFAVRIHTFFAFALVAGVATCFVAALLKYRGGPAALGPAFSSDGVPPSIQILQILEVTLFQGRAEPIRDGLLRPAAPILLNGFGSMSNPNRNMERKPNRSVKSSSLLRLPTMNYLP